MTHTLYVILTSIVLGLDFVITAMLINIYRRHRAKIEKLAIYLQLSLLSSISIAFINLFIPNLIIFQISIIIGFISYVLFILVFFTFLEDSGAKRPKRERTILMSYSVGLVICIAILAFFQVKTVPVEGGISFGLDLSLVVLPAILMVLPNIHMMIISWQFFIKLYDRDMRFKLILFYSLLFSYFTSLFLFLYVIQVRMVAGFVLIVTEVGFVLFLKFNHNFLAQVHSTFAYKRVFIIRNNGQTIYSYDFTSEPAMKEVKTVQYLIGGFIYAITHGIKEIVKQEYEATLRSMNFGKLKMLFYYGTHVFGVLFSREANAVIYNRLQRFVSGFEETFKEIVEDPTVVVLLDGTTDKEKDPDLNKEINKLLTLYFKF